MQMVRRWMLGDDDGDDDGLLYSLTRERLNHRTDRGAGWRHVQQLMHFLFKFQQVFSTKNMIQISTSVKERHNYKITTKY